MTDEKAGLTVLFALLAAGVLAPPAAEARITEPALESTEEGERAPPDGSFVHEAPRKAGTARGPPGAGYPVIGRDLAAAIDPFQPVAREDPETACAAALNRFVGCFLASGIADGAGRPLPEGGQVHEAPQEAPPKAGTARGPPAAGHPAIGRDLAAAIEPFRPIVRDAPETGCAAALNRFVGCFLASGMTDGAGRSASVRGDTGADSRRYRKGPAPAPGEGNGRARERYFANPGGAGENGRTAVVDLPRGHELRARSVLIDRRPATDKGRAGPAPDRRPASEAGRGPRPRGTSGAASETRRNRISLRSSGIRGADILNTGRGVPPGSAAGDEWHRDARVGIEVVRSDRMTLDLYGDVRDRRTFARQGEFRQGDFSLGRTTDGEQIVTNNFGLDLGLLGGRFRYATRYSVSNDHGSSDAGDGAKTETASAQTHRIDADLLDSRLMKVSAYGLHRRIDPLFRALEGRIGWGEGLDDAISGADRAPRGPMGAGDTFNFFDLGETVEFGAATTFGFGELSFSQRRKRASLFPFVTGRLGQLSFSQGPNLINGGEDSRTRTTTRRLAGSLDVGLAKVLLSQESQEDVANTSDGGGSRRLTYSGGIELKLDEFLLSSDTDRRTGFGRLLPSWVRLSASRGTHKDVNAIIDRPDLETRWGLDFYWDWGDAETDVGFARRVYDSREVDNGATDTEERSIDISQSFFGDNWDLSGDLSLYREVARGEGDNSVDWGLTGGLYFDYSAEYLPAMSLSLDHDWDSFFAADDGYESGDRSWGIGLSLDFAKYVPIFARDEKSRLKLTYYGESTSSYDSEDGTSNEWNHAISVSGRIGF